MFKKFASTPGLIGAFLLFLVANFVFSNVLPRMRADLTEGGLYSLSQGSRNILGRLEQDITLRLYFSETLAKEYPGLPAYGKRIRELLEEYEDESSGRLTFEFIEPKPFSVEEDRALGHGLSGPAVNRSGDRLYFGLVGTNSVDDEEIIPFFEVSKETTLEYDLTKLVANLANLDKKVVGIMSGLPVQGTPDFSNPQMPRPGQPWHVVERLQATYDTRFLDAASTDSIDSEISVLLVIHPKDFSDQAFYAIDQFALNGGRVIAFVDPFCQFDPSAGQGQQAQFAPPASSDLGPLLGAWGLELGEGKVVGDNKLLYNNLLPFLSLSKEESFSQEDVTTLDLGMLTMLFAGVLTETGVDGLQIEPLMHSSEESQLLEAMMVKFQMNNPESMRDSFVSTGAKQLLAARVRGNAKSAFPDGKPKEPLAEGEEEPTEEEAGDATHVESGDIQVVVIADADMLNDGLWVQFQNFFGQRMAQVMADNGDFVSNLVENMTGSDDMISLRSRGKSKRIFDKKKELEDDANERFRAKEQELEAKLQETERRINELQQEKEGVGRLILTPAQEAEIEKFRDEKVETRKALRKVQHDLQGEIDALGTRLKVINIGGIPLLILLLLIGQWLMRLSAGKAR